MFWYILYGVLIGLGVYYLATRPNLKVEWYDWVMLILSALFLILGLQNFFASFRELEPTAAWVLLIAFLVPTLILGAIVAFRLLRQKPEEPAPQKKAAAQ